MTSGFGALIIGILATVLYELMKQFFLFIWFQKEEKIEASSVCVKHICLPHGI